MLNLPTTSFRDIAFKGNDLIVGTYGRGIFVLDDYAVLRQMNASVPNEDVHLFKPDGASAPASQRRRGHAVPADVPHALNPPDGAIIYYWLRLRSRAARVTLDVLDSAGAGGAALFERSHHAGARGGATAASELLGERWSSRSSTDAACTA
jgi:hypothetical protein